VNKIFEPWSKKARAKIAEAYTLPPPPAPEKFLIEAEDMPESEREQLQRLLTESELRELEISKKRDGLLMELSKKGRLTLDAQAEKEAAVKELTLLKEEHDDLVKRSHSTSLS